MFKRLPYLLIAIFVLANISYAGILNEDVAYWYWADDEKTIVETIFNPSSAQLKQIRSKLLIKVQQTVYDPETTAQILNQANGYLYAYSVTNLGWMPDANGLIIFGVEWGDAVPTLVTVSNQTPSGWLPTTFSVSQGDPFNGPAWQWMGAPNVPGLTIGQTVGGFWAVSPYPESPEPCMLCP